MRQGVILSMVASLVLCWGKTVIISADRRVIADLGERRRGENKRDREGKIENEAQLRTIPEYSTIKRDKPITKINRHPVSNAHAKSNMLPKPGFKPQSWPYDENERKPNIKVTTAHPRWTHNPPVNEEINAGLITHYAVRPVNTNPEVSLEDHIDKIISSLAYQHYPQIQPNKQDPYQTNFKQSTRPQYSSYYPHHTVTGIKTTSHGVPTTPRPRITTPVYAPGKLVTWVPHEDYNIDYDNVNYITGLNVIPEMAAYDGVDYITGDNVISEMRPNPTNKPNNPIFTLQTTRPIIVTTKPVYTLQTIKPMLPNKTTITTRKPYKPIYNFFSTMQPSSSIKTTRYTTSKPAYTGPPTYKPTYRPGFHLTPTQPTRPTRPVPVYSTTTSAYKPTIKPAVLATFKPTLSVISNTQQPNTTTTKNPFPTYPFPVLPDFDPVTPSTTTVEDLNVVIIEADIETTTVVADITIPGLDGVAIPGSADAMVEYVTSIMNQLRSLLLFAEDGSEQDMMQGMAAMSTVVGLPMITGMLSALGAGPAVVIAVAWLLPIGLLMVVPGIAG